MSDGRFYMICLLLFGAFVIAALVTMNVLQPTGIDVQMWNLILTPATSIISSLLVLVNSNHNRGQIETQSKQVERKVEVAAYEANTAARNAAIAAGTEVPPKTEKTAPRS